MTTRRGRPPRYDRDTALRAIVETFRRHGFAATSLDDLAAATGMNRPSLFAAFGNKRAMYLAALENFRSAMVNAVEPALLRENSLVDALKAFFDAAIRFYCRGESRGCLVLCTAPTEASNDSEIRGLLADTLLQIEGHIKHRIEQAASEFGQTKISNAEPISKALSAVLVSIAIQARAGASEAELADFSAQSVSLIVHQCVSTRVF